MITDFEYIYNTFGGNCHIQNCNVFKRHFRNREKNHFEEENDRIMGVFDTIHCHFQHQYDIGIRLNSEEQNSNPSQKSKILRNKCSVRNKLIPMYMNNKYSQNLGQFKVNEKQQDSSLAKYSYSFDFHYKERFKNDQQFAFGKLRYSDTYVPPKHNSLKDELIANKIHCIDINDWDIQMTKAMDFKDTMVARKQYAKTQQRYHYLSAQAPYNPINFGYEDGTPLTTKHLIVLIMYCSFDKFQTDFTETYRKKKRSEE
eukprot:429846_1